MSPNWLYVTKTGFEKTPETRKNSGVTDGARTHDNRNHNQSDQKRALINRAQVSMATACVTSSGTIVAHHFEATPLPFSQARMPAMPSMPNNTCMVMLVSS